MLNNWTLECMCQQHYQPWEAGHHCTFLGALAKIFVCVGGGGGGGGLTILVDAKFTLGIFEALYLPGVH